jgi:hypothetical protein
LLENYKTASSGKFDYKFVDPEADPVAAQTAKNTRDGTLVVSMDGRSEQVSYADETDLSARAGTLDESRKAQYLSSHRAWRIQSGCFIR